MSPLTQGRELKSEINNVAGTRIKSPLAQGRELKLLPVAG